MKKLVVLACLMTIAWAGAAAAGYRVGNNSYCYLSDSYGHLIGYPYDNVSNSLCASRYAVGNNSYCYAADSSGNLIGYPYDNVSNNLCASRY